METITRPSHFDYTRGMGKKGFLFALTQGRCAYCGMFLDKINFSIDHVIPIRHGGNSNIENLFACCRICNIQKGDRSIYRLKELLANPLRFTIKQLDYLSEFGFKIPDNYGIKTLYFEELIKSKELLVSSNLLDQSRHLFNCEKQGMSRNEKSSAIYQYQVIDSE